MVPGLIDILPGWPMVLDRGLELRSPTPVGSRPGAEVPLDTLEASAPGPAACPCYELEVLADLLNGAEQQSVMARPAWFGCDRLAAAAPLDLLQTEGLTLATGILIRCCFGLSGLVIFALGHRTGPRV